MKCKNKYFFGMVFVLILILCLSSFSLAKTNNKLISSNYNSSYVPYVGSNHNVVLGDYNFSVGGTDFFVNTNTYSISSGTSTASGLYSVALGYSSTALGPSSVAVGNHAFSSGDSSIALGHYANASGDSSIALGDLTKSSGASSTATGFATTASGFLSTAMGREIIAGGDYSFAIALNDQNNLNVSQANTMAIMGGNVGIGTSNPQYNLDVNGSIHSTNDFILGDYNGGYLAFILADSFNIRSGNKEIFKIDFTSAGDESLYFSPGANSSKAFVVNNNGNVGIKTNNPQNALTVIGDGKFTGNFYVGENTLLINPNKHSMSMGYYANASNLYSTAIGPSTLASEIGAIAMGGATISSGYYSTATGYGSESSQYYSTAMGEYTESSGYSSMSTGGYTKALGDYSTAMGYSTTASETASTAMGSGTISSGYGSTAMGLVTVSSGEASTSFGRNTIASGPYSVAMGKGIEVSGSNSVGIGLNDQSGTIVSQANTMAIMGGKVGIGTTTPQSELDVNGDISFSGNLISQNNIGLTGNYSVGNCWMAFSDGIMYETNCDEN
ncbi:MAG: hypothetical protein WC812_02815 [Candidatus Pacearchaeota archaeon]|jgi:hypothetical protein